nr:uncharacterized protein LOC106836618 isoform X5 [Equus asinus]XP_044618143.1 uncharacterized protein LOC106836618 isoform X5 [Equus asinus]XP_044618144.1 uncharacterized protein LOC106836618 isoform X5 [Equus asinus]
MKAVTSSWRDFTHHVPFEAVRSTAQSAARSPVRIPAAVPWPSPRFPAGDPAAGTGRDRPTARLLRPASSPASALLPLLHLRSASRYSKPCDSGSCDSRQSGAAERQLGIDFCTLPHHYDNGSVGSIFNAVGRDSVKGMKKKNVDADAGERQLREAESLYVTKLGRDGDRSQTTVRGVSWDGLKAEGWSRWPTHLPLPKAGVCWNITCGCSQNIHTWTSVWLLGCLTL